MTIAEPMPDEKPQEQPQLKIGFVLAPQFTLTAFAGFIDAIRLAGDESDRSRPIACYWEVLSADDKLIESSCGVSVKPWGELRNPARFDYIVVVGGLLHGGPGVSSFINRFLIRAAASRVPLIGLCTGSFILARAGLLDGYGVCVSWLHKEQFQTEFPTLKAQSDTLFLIDRDRMTCAGGTSVLHLAARIIDRHISRAQALKSLRIMLEEVPSQAAAWQPEQIITQQAADPVVRRAMLLMEEKLQPPIPYPEIAQRLAISPRQLERRFKADVGLTPSDYRQQIRLLHADRLIRNTTHSMTEIAFWCGFSDSSHLSRAFRKQFSMTPTVARLSIAQEAGADRQNGARAR